MMIGSPDQDRTNVTVSILVVDDQPNNRAALRAILGSPDYRIVETGSGREALRRLLDEEFAVVLLDVVMPDVNGFEVATAIKERERTAWLPIVFMTAQATDVDLIYKGYRVGAVDYLTKPLVPEIVRAKVAVFAELYRQKKRIEHQSARLVEAERREHELRVTELQLTSERRYRTLAESVPHIVWTARPDGSVDYFNQRWFEYTGMSTEDAAGSWVGALHPADAWPCRTRWQDAVRSGEMFQAEGRLRRASDGAFRWHLGRAVPERGGTGQILSWFGTFTDIEDQKRVEAVLAEFKGTLDAVIDAVFIFDPEDWRFLYVNQGASVLLGYSEDELLRMWPVDFMTEHDAESFRQLLAPLGATSTITLETEFRRKDRRVVPVEVSLQLIHADGGRIVAIARDISDRKRAQLERELLYRDAIDAIRVRDEFLSVASHELRNPLGALQLHIDMLRTDPEILSSPERAKAKLDLVTRQVERMSHLITELLDVSRIAAGRLQLQLEEVDLAELLRGVINRLTTAATSARCAITLTAPEPVFGRWDPMRLEQVATNLITNALKFGAGKPIELDVAQHGSLARLTVRDHGIGIAPQDIDRIFERYEQASSSRAFGGLGLGLYIVRQIVEAHGGTIRAESQLGAGSTFTVELPRDPLSAALDHPVPHPGDRSAEI
jgi:PAS domain S-box-containing protein